MVSVSLPARVPRMRNYHGSIGSLLLVWVLLAGSVKGFAPPNCPSTYTISRAGITVRLSEAVYPWEGPLRDTTMQQFAKEETLLQIHCSTTTADGEVDSVLPQIQKYIQSFPFAAVLPVQPLQYLPTADGGVEVLFLRKKTKEKGAIDGGLRFFVVRIPDKKELEIVVKRNSEGQTISKIFSEKMVVQAFVNSFMGKDVQEGKQPMTNREAPTKELVQVESVFHKWMDGLLA
jgi:hypothetical protein